MPFYNHADIFTIFREKNYSNFTLSFAFSHMNIFTQRYLHLPSLFLYFFYRELSPLTTSFSVLSITKLLHQHAKKHKLFPARLPMTSMI